MIRSRVTGAVELRYLARLVERQRKAGLKKELSKAQRDAFKPLGPAIKASAAASLPHAGGYAGVMARSVKVAVRKQGLSYIAIVSARGKTQERDVRTINAGRLRHPLFRNRGHWFTTRVRPGFVDRPAKELGERIASESLDALERIGKEIARG